MAEGVARVTAIIPTTVEHSRRESLFRAIASLQAQTGVRLQILLAANGTRFDLDTLVQLHQRDDIQVFYCGASGVSGAQRRGRELVTGEFFCFLDDDDVYLPGALSTRLAAMRSDSSIDVVATNGKTWRGDPLFSPEEMERAQRDPYLALTKRNWLSSCGGLFRTSTIDSKFFDGRTNFMEWTLLAFKLVAAGKRICVLPDETFSLNNTPGSLSKTDSYAYAKVEVLNSILALNLAKDMQDAVRARLGPALHAVAQYELEAGRWPSALTAHIRSLLAPQGWRYITYSRKFVMRGP